MNTETIISNPNTESNETLDLKREKALHRNKTILSVTFVVYLLFLTWIILFKMEVPQKWHTLVRGVRDLNLAPLKYIDWQLQSLTSDFVSNIFAFMPLGFFLLIFSKRYLVLKIALPLLISLIYETLQYIFMIGVADINDLIANTVGSWLGMVLAAIIWKIFNEKHRVYRLVAWPLAIGGFILVCGITFLSLYPQ